MPSRAMVQAFIALVERGEYVKAIEDYYHPDASMQENGLPPRDGAGLHRPRRAGRVREGDRGLLSPRRVHAGDGLPPRVGRQTLVEHEKAVLAGLAAMRTRRVETFLVDGDRVVINWVFEMTGPDGNMRVFDELALQLWDGDRIRRERFYYDPAQLRVQQAALGAGG